MYQKDSLFGMDAAPAGSLPDAVFAVVRHSLIELLGMAAIFG